MVCIGPKLPLPVWMQRNTFNNVQSVSIKTEKLCNNTSLKADQQKLSQKKPIVLKVYTCSKCQLKHSDSALHEAHVATCVSISTSDVSSSQVCYKDKKGLFCCEFCIFKFKQKRYLSSHQNKHVKCKGFTCSVCFSEFHSVKKLQIHYDDFHKNDIKIFSCNLCEYSNTTVRRIKEHMIRHNSDKYLYCYKCRQNYENVKDFNQHSCKSLKKIFVKRKTPSEVHKRGDKQSTTNHSSAKLSNLKSKFESEVIKTNDTYYCNGCSYSFSKYDYLVKHKQEHLKIQPYKCKVCNYESFSVVDIGKHVKCHFSQEVKSVRIKCSACYMTFRQWQMLRRHAVYHIYDELYCSSCRTNFEDSETLIQHMSSSHNHSIKDKMYFCSKCSFKCTFSKALRKHVKLHLDKEIKMASVSEGDILVVDSNLKSNALPKNINLADETSSIKTTNVPSAFKCTSCRIRFDNAVAFEKHNKGHHSDSAQVSSHQKESPTLLFKCNKCKYECSNINSFIGHEKLNHLNKENPFTCLVCNQTMESLKSYLSHLKSHKETPTYCCQYCKYHTRKTKSFLQHFINHNLKCCPMCIYSTQSFQALKKHVNRQHKPRNMQRPFVCSLCPYSSSKEKVLSVHALKFHPKEYPSLKLPIPNYLNKSGNNSEDMNSCSICQFRNYSIYEFKRHLSRHFVNGQLNVKALRKGVKNKSQTLKSTHLTKLKTRMKKASKSGPSSFAYACSQCDFKSENNSTVASHLRAIHKIKGGLRDNTILKLNTPLCNKTKNNMLKTEKSVIRRCKFENCEVEKFSLNAQKQHKNKGHTAFWARPFACLKCSSRFKSDMYLKRHKCEKSKSSLTCKVCNKYKTTFDQKMENHLKMCAKSSTTTNEVSKPSITPHQQQNTIIRTMNLSEDEEQLSSGDESFSCGECNFVTSDVTDLIKHMFIHTGLQDD